ncbi:glycine--tRNA ligase subunit beta [Candidatus Nitrotoga sp. AM1P]|uniref:glycine--tRNA ligase subunit beta n=1 Tax=Candidatus Nitrotoga sp. AM1P TaxID=2559597 RepID=UPI0010BC126D|nr:glycine--tRNA ligase subunit beta [Candidatus Nitrotoga sp. AM1P]BBJ23455.1 glycine--tRNA ligase beta subunit [Candidatus Nitrotoga sp. AM1P]
MKQTLLIELLTEELPPKALERLSIVFANEVFTELREQELAGEDSKCTPFATPRRLALTITNVASQQADRVIERKGPTVAAGLDAEGKPSKALEGFMRGAGVTFEQLQRNNDDKTEYFVARIEKKGQPLDVYLADFITQALKKLPVPKLMRWGDSDHQFVRPVHALIMLHGERIVPGEVLGLQSGRLTSGHRFLHTGDIPVVCADSYEEALLTHGKIIASFEKRRTRIDEYLKAKAHELNARINPSDGLLDEVTALVEWPVVYVGEFEEEYLEVPQECLILTMQQNQKYFPLLDNDGKLLNKFLIVSNMQVDNPKHIIDGNQRVVRPRLADARFFFNQDRKLTLESRVAKLGNVVYHNKLGTQLQRIERITTLAGAIARQLNAEKSVAELAARLAKADLTTDMVGEFPELQGIMGRYYALHDGENQVVADAISAHYHPRFAGDTLPHGAVACAVALADKLDTLVGIYGIGLVPTGDKDPFGLRRHALGVLRILIETPLALPLDMLLQLSKDSFTAGKLSDSVVADVHGFMLERLRGYLRERDFSPDEIEAVVCQNPTRIDLVMPRLDAVCTFRKLPEAAALAAANKRIQNILKKTATVEVAIQPELLQENAERRLYEVIQRLSPQVEAGIRKQDYTAMLTLLASARAVVDEFFDKVMVMAEDPAVRNNRLALLKQLADLMNKVADISKLAT